VATPTQWVTQFLHWCLVWFFQPLALGLGARVLTIHHLFRQEVRQGSLYGQDMAGRAADKPGADLGFLEARGRCGAAFLEAAPESRH